MNDTKTWYNLEKNFHAEYRSAKRDLALVELA